MTKHCAILILMAFLTLNCTGQKAEFINEGANYFGSKISADKAQALSALDLDLQENDTLQIALTGTINEVCQAKGCWMTLEDQETQKSIFIRFKDYSFFVPKDAGGKNAVVKGKLFNHITSVEELRHYAKDKGQSSQEIAAIDKPKEELRMTAEGVIIYNN